MSDLNNLKDTLNELVKDKKITDKNVLSNYLNIVSQNMKDNIKAINRNSYLLIMSGILFLLIKSNLLKLSENGVFGYKINSDDTTITLNLILVVFSFLYFKNISIWYKNMNLKLRFDTIATRLFDLGINTDSLHLLRPFSIIENIDYYLISNKEVKGFKKLVVSISIVIFVLIPPVFIVYSLYYLIANSYTSFISVTCITTTIIFLILSILQAFYTNRF